MRISDWSSDVCSSDLTAKPCPRGHTPQWMGLGGGKYLMDVLAKRVADLKVDVRFDARAVALIVAAGNRVVGLVVRSEGRDQFVRALKSTEDGRVGKAWVSACRFQWTPCRSTINSYRLNQLMTP